MTRQETMLVQSILKRLGLYKGNVDGIAGPMTSSAVMAYQRMKGLTADGIVGPKTRAVLFPAQPVDHVPVTKPKRSFWQFLKYLFSKEPVDQPAPPVIKGTVVTSIPSTGIFYIGAAKRLDPNDIAKVAAAIGLDAAIFHAFLSVESNGKAFDAKGRPTLLYEPHLAFRYAPKDKLQALIAAGLAYEKWGTKPYPATIDARYAQVDACRKIAGDECAADSSSWGGPQICGFNAHACGYIDAVSMVRAFAAGEENQIAAMAAFILNNKTLYAALKRLDFDTAAECYNGAAYRKNDYAGKLHTAYAQYKKG